MLTYQPSLIINFRIYTIFGVKFIYFFFYYQKKLIKI